MTLLYSDDRFHCIVYSSTAEALYNPIITVQTSITYKCDERNLGV